MAARTPFLLMFTADVSRQLLTKSEIGTPFLKWSQLGYVRN